MSLYKTKEKLNIDELVNNINNAIKEVNNQIENLSEEDKKNKYFYNTNNKTNQPFYF